MPRKSSKTTHVLNLLSGSEEHDESSITDCADSGAPDQITVVMPKKSADPVADIIRARLEEEFSPTELDEQPQPPELAPVGADKNEPLEQISEKPQGVDYAYVNVMEHIIQEEVEGFCQEFETCTCSRCLADIAALALTNLPPKYIVKDCLTISPLLNYYRSKYSSQVTVSLTKSSMSVKDKPRH
ncbi:late competence development ComFB family protein [Parasporobacterium paucivorans]|uniref:Late competence development protein ComFB n=1 Tax=Parasporobacterium paucivorans DSM 15970 TaxID=1122934 RepID=A0A1M6GEY2_9FIRM|nr:late competence development ComFB family protein [Parasporobacterium paucivorans]SHJ08524.1 Late competence development protein ComFB [Parasporobacterium paucivorans DSM 15970]